MTTVREQKQNIDDLSLNTNTSKKLDIEISHVREDNVYSHYAHRLEIS